MSLEVIIVIIFSLLSVGFFLALQAVLRPRLNVRKRVMAGEASAAPPTEAEELGLYESLEKILAPLGEMLRRPPEDLSKEQQRLIQAGIRRKNAVYFFYGFKVALAGALFLIAAATGFLLNYTLLTVVGCIFAGTALPDIWLRRRIAARQRRIQLGLPDMMDLTVICSEAGMGLDQALIRISNEIRPHSPDLAEELHLYSLEVNAGKSRSEALRNLGRRTGVDDLKALCSVLNQANTFGTSIADSLRTFADSLRVKRRQRAEEIAAQMGTKMIIPLVIFIFPAIFVVVVGPAVITIVRDFLPGLGK